MPKYADPAVYTVGTPGSTDLVMTRKADASDGNFALGNLAGIAPVTVANDQALTYTGGAWASYSLTAAGRALSGVAGTANTFPYFSAANVVTLGTVGATGLASLAAATQAAGRTALGLGTAATQNTGTSGANVPLLSSNNTWSGMQTFSYNGTATESPLTSTTTGPITLALSRTGRTGTGGNSVVQYSIGFDSGTTVSMYFGLNVLASAPSFAVGSDPNLSNDPTTFFRASNVSFSPGANNTTTLGDSTRRWSQVFATNGTINTSDARLKTEPRQLRDAEFKAASAIARLPAVWRWLNRVHGDENCEPEGREARKHFGPTVQAAIEVMEANGLDPFAYSFICYDEWEAEEATYDDDGNELTPAHEAGDRYSFRKEELLCFIVRALAQEIDGLAERVAALEAKA